MTHAAPWFLFSGVIWQPLKEVVDKGVRLRGRNVVVLPKKDEPARAWLVVFFGLAQSSPPEWTIKTVVRSSAKIRVTFASPPRAVQRTRDSTPFFLFVPLPDLKPGAYELELQESGGNDVVLMRKVVVQTNDQ